MKNILTYENALKICNAYNNENFYSNTTIIGGYKVITFNYFMCAPEWFETPILSQPELSAYDMRGITFVFNKDGSLFRRYLMLPKFFNYNQIEQTSLENLKKKEISYVTIKEDGSLIAFMQLPNGKIFAKTKNGFSNEQSENAMKLYRENPSIRLFVNDMVNLNKTPLFEYVAPDNRIVLKYKEKELRLIGLRYNETEEFIHSSQIQYTAIKYGISYINSINIQTIEELIERCKNEQNTEGYVVYFTDGSIVKFKTDWYFNAHGIRTENIFREDYIIEKYLTESLDDVMQELDRDYDKDAFDFIDKVIKGVNNWKKHINELSNELITLYTGDFIEFATKYNRKPFFNLVKIKLLNPEEYNNKCIEFMIYNTRKLNMARNIIEKFKDK